MHLHPITNKHVSFINHKMSCKIQVIQQLPRFISIQFSINILLVCLFCLEYAILVCVSVSQPAPDKLEGSNHLHQLHQLHLCFRGFPISSSTIFYDCSLQKVGCVYHFSSTVQFNFLKNSNFRDLSTTSPYTSSTNHKCVRILIIK